MNDFEVNNDTELSGAIAAVGMSSLGPSDWHWGFCYKPFWADNRKGWLVWVEFDRIDYATGLPGRGRGRDMILWSGTQKSGVVKTYYALVEQVVRHELFHAFRYNGRELFDPHAPVDLLHSISGKAVADAYNHFRPPPVDPMSNAVERSGEIG